MKTPFERLILHSRYGGLGDHLFMSHLPRVAKSCGVKTVLVSNKAPFRDLAYRKLIWELNPYVDGFTEETGPPIPAVPVDKEMNNLDAMMLAHGLDDGQRFHEPEIYYKPALREDVVGKTLYDPNYVSFVGWLRPQSVERYLHAHNISVDLQMKLRNRSLPLRSPVPSVNCTSVFEYCNVIHSCYAFFGLMSGGTEIAAALKKAGTIFYGPGHNAAFRHSRRHSYVYVPDPFWRVAKFEYFAKRRLRQLFRLPVNNL